MLTQVSLFSALIRLADMLGRWDARKYVNSSSFDVRIAGVFGLCRCVGLLTVACLTSGRFVNGSVKGIQFPNMLWALFARRFVNSSLFDIRFAWLFRTSSHADLFTAGRLTSG